MRNLKKPGIIVALDEMGKKETIKTIKELGRMVWGYKISGLLFTHGQQIFEEIQKEAGSVNLFIDLRFSGPPRAIRESVLACFHPDVSFLSINFTSGIKGIRAAVEATRISKALIYSLDSSLSITDVNFIFNTSLRQIQTFKAAQMVKETGAHGLYLAASELMFLSHPDYSDIMKNIEIVTVAIRPEWYPKKGVHEFVMTPREAMERGATKLVIGSPITKARNKTKAVERILKEIRIN